MDEWGSRGSGPVEFHWPDGMYLDEWGFLYVVDRVNRRVQKLGRDGTYLGEFDSVVEGTTDTTPQGIVVGEGNAFVLHGAANLIRRFTFETP